MDSAVRASDHELLLARCRMGLRAMAIGLSLFALADVRLVGTALHETLVVRLVQFGLIVAGAFVFRTRLSHRAHVAAIVLLVGGLYATSAVAGVLRGSIATQPITDLAIAFATATTLPWGPWPQLATVVVAVLAIAGGAHAVGDGLFRTSPHMAAGVGVSFLVSVYIAHQLERYRRERDAAEAALRRNEERFRSLIERGSDIITIVGPDGTIDYDSPSIERLLGYTPTERVGRSAGAFVHPDDLELVRAAFHRAAGDRLASVECRVARRDGSWCDVEASLSNLVDHPAVGGIVVNWRDVCERKRADEERARHVAELARARDQALASTRAKSTFLANVSHEIRTPLNVVIGMADMVLDSALDPTQRDEVERIRAATIGLLGVINDILDTSKIEAGKMTIARVDLDLRAVIEEATALLAPAAAAKGLSLACTVAPDVPARTSGDPVRLRQTIVNLVGNAVKFTESGGVAVDARVVRRARGHVTVRVGVADSGIGIPLDRQGGIFESFAQADESVGRVYGGTGLGLTICREIVTLMGGRMGVDSEVGRGSTFWFEVPFECAAIGAAA